MNISDERTGNPPQRHVVMERGLDDEEPPGKPRRHPLWRNVPKKQWDDWRWQMQNAIRSVRQLRELLPIEPADLEIMGQLEAEYKLAIPPYYFSLIDVNDPHDPIRLQSVTSPLEAKSSFEMEDPLEEDQDSPVPGITHRYPDRVLMVTTHVCTMYCRFCTRKRATMVRGGWDAVNRDDERMIDYIRAHREIRDVIVSGGDPLTLPYPKLQWYLHQLRDIPHVDVVRIGTRVPTTLPQKLFDKELIDILASAEKVWIQTHFNHPREITPEVARVAKTLLRAGMPLNNHTVLMKGINDDVETMRQLMRALLRVKIRPYYLFHCDPVTGAGHFRTSIWKGLEIMEGLRGHISGLAVPTYAVDAPHGGGKIPLLPNYLVSASDDCVVLRNYEGMLVRYQAEDKPTTIRETVNRGVSQLMQGTRTALVPNGNERMARRRRNRELAAQRRTEEAAAANKNTAVAPASQPLLVPLPVLSLSAAAGGP
ncbi:MAG: KamA family radical SAM protein [Gemmataceae bacterium]|nr:KamA family radical SAM protein [Gemmataceae bacterium]